MDGNKRNKEQRREKEVGGDKIKWKGKGGKEWDRKREETKQRSTGEDKRNEVVNYLTRGHPKATMHTKRRIARSKRNKEYRRKEKPE